MKTYKRKSGGTITSSELKAVNKIFLEKESQSKMARMATRITRITSKGVKPLEKN